MNVLVLDISIDRYIYILAILQKAMRVTRGFNIDVEIDEKLRNESNRSGLVNELLRKHYLQDISQQELEKLRDEEKKKLEIAKKRLEKIEKELKEYNNSKLKGVIVRHT